ncbi:SigE family RNA polymerase sigma factor [Aeromicrobium fastidiosum]|uniref:SigE family RNA polymerase sigma factor n=1 Tax=Aeromicrobium fastidiosum TaxID=52699 RepID=A0A641AR26_9ACTN|nr:SigE family RNA polymerase sigma factor [Aeromicrobium fastidiosum]KAA1380389.1 SigE family RNA polymerase sigma factor [Aeromicrobium fastidiosum]MBP2389962.1 RNA polymerase sigma-70 factor (sigma-E family) [Aeromicrobium fastidiosum]
MRSEKDEEFRAYVLAHRADLVRTATLLTAGDAHLAEDVVQSTLTRLYVSWPLFVRAGNREGYARRALVNALMDEHRRPWRRRESAAESVPDLRVVEPDAGSTRTEALMSALRELPPRMRSAVVYRYFHDLSVSETADALGCSQGTVKSQTARALDRLRGVLDPPAGLTPSNPTVPTRQTPYLPRSL